jgi:hypothetical protein
MATWKLPGTLPQGQNADEIRNASLGGWNPWQYQWSCLDAPAIIVPNVENALRPWHVPLCIAGPLGSEIKFAALWHDNGDCSFYVPAGPGEEGAFEASSPKFEDFWQRSADETSKLPWPEVDESWTGRRDFLDTLYEKEMIAEKIAYRGYSTLEYADAGTDFKRFTWPNGSGHRDLVTTSKITLSDHAPSSSLLLCGRSIKP